jgi:hypothetical protein
MAQPGEYGSGYTQAGGFGPQGQNPRVQLPATPPQFHRQAPQPQEFPPAGQPQFQPAWQPAPQQWPAREASGYAGPQEPVARPLRKTSLTAAEQFWYVLMNIGFGAGYFAKIPAKKAMADFGLAEMTAAEKFWYVLMCIPFGAAYFVKVPVAKAITEMQYGR